MMIPTLVFTARSERASANPSSPRQHDVEQDDVNAGFLDDPAQFAPVMRDGNPIALVGQIVPHHLADFLLVIDDQDVLAIIHFSVFPGRWSCWRLSSGARRNITLLLIIYTIVSTENSTTRQIFSDFLRYIL
jgi:hypothetical protein